MRRRAVFLACITLGLFFYRLEASIIEFHSQAMQDQFVHLMVYDFLGKSDQGCYLEIGAGEPIHINNSYFFEKNLKWKGVSIDISEDLGLRWYAVRENLLLRENAVTANYKEILQSFPKVIDYLSLDIDAQYVDVLKRIPFDEYVFKVITIEHDAYRFGDLYRKEERQILQSLGYHLLCSDVSLLGYCFEDWWVHPSFFSSSQFVNLCSLDLKGKDCKELILLLQEALISGRK